MADINMKKILIAIYDYYPEPSANTLCLKRILDSMNGKNEIHIVCMKHIVEKCSDYENFDNIHIHRISLPENSIAKKMIAGNKKLLYRVLNKLFSVWNFLIYGFSGYPECYQSKRMQKKLEHIIDKYDIDTLFSISFPFSTHVVCSKLKEKNPQLNWIAYELDPFTFNFILPAKQRKKRAKKEMQVFKNADKIISSLGIDEYNLSKNFRNEYRHKTVSVALPGLIKSRTSDISKSVLNKKAAVNLVYSGSFYGDLRNPKPLLEILHNSEQSKDIAVHIMGGSIDKKQYPKAEDLNIFEYKRTSPDVCDASVIDADIAINFDNRIPNQMPSKLLNYMALNKPIVNFYYKDCLLGESCLKNYNPHLSICVDDVCDENVKKAFFEFVFKYGKENKQSVFDNNIQKELLNDYVCSRIINTISE